MLLTPGASASRDQPALVAIDRAVTALGLRVERIDFPYHLAGRRRPDPAPVLVESVSTAALTLAASVRGGSRSVFLGGRSMGGRMCSMAVAAGLPAAGLVLVSYPLHPPGKPERLRTEHFPDLRVPCLFVSGRRDPFGSPEELEAATAAIPGSVSRHFLDGDHSLRRQDALVASVVAEWIQAQQVAAAG